MPISMPKPTGGPTVVGSGVKGLEGLKPSSKGPKKVKVGA